ncbi:maleylpyruvate isomerase family mycothiol-dependent enzyme [Streptomyces sp. NBC_01304]|uniref:maleylpyruvate isomerase family mycothiol-dependent enzyme n=1 Tax=Streptomyces sp. NBC_01304 TaxID=2903818 RepID=UPI002E0D747D|nr:maleylpyruvate isomerase family mycothiol-dependent enzyme [Streptomyces sp. NBC_01304]
MSLLDHERYCAEIVHQTEQLIALLPGADLAATVPSCPDWNLRRLVLHVGGAHRWAEFLVRTRAVEHTERPKLDQYTGPDDDAHALGAYLLAGAERLVAALREAGPETKVWAWVGMSNARFWARRMTLETLIHRADVALTVGAEFEVAPEVAADAIDELLEILPHVPRAELATTAAELNGRSLHLHATDSPVEVNAEWLIAFGDEGFTWRRGHEKATVALRGPLAEVVRVFFRRLPADSERVEVLGDRALLDTWLARSTFG